MVIVTAQTFDSLLIDLKEIEIICLGADNSSKAKLDKFQTAKLDLNNVLTRMKEDINQISQYPERSGEAVRIKHRLKKDLATASSAKERIEKELKKDEAKFKKNKKNALSKEEIEERRKVSKLLFKEYEFVQSKVDKNVEEVKTYSKATDERERRRKERRERRKKRKGQAQEEEPERALTKEEEAFLQRSFEKDQQIDEELSDIYKGLKNLNTKAVKINLKLDEQGKMIDKVDEKITETHNKLESTSKQMDLLLEKSGGLKRWIPIIIVTILLIAAVGYAFKITLGI